MNEIQPKKTRLFLSISFCFFAWTIIELGILLFRTYLQIQADLPNDPSKAKTQFIIHLIFAIIWFFPGILSELSFIRSGYKILKHNPMGVNRACYIISALLALFLVIFTWLVFVITANFNLPGGDNNILNLLLIGWPCVLLSFLLGCIPTKKVKTIINERAEKFLYIGLIVFFISIIAIIVTSILKYYQIKERFFYDPGERANNIALMQTFIAFIIIPILSAELSCIRSIYKLFKYIPQGIVKMCYLISAFLAFITCSFFALLLLGVLFDITTANKIQNDILLLPGIPCLIVSFILGSLPAKKLSRPEDSSLS